MKTLLRLSIPVFVLAILALGVAGVAFARELDLDQWWTIPRELTAQSSVADDNPGGEFEFTGVVEVMSDTSWTISGTLVTITPETEIEDMIVVGDRVKVEGIIAPDGTWVAREIELLNGGDDDDEIHFVGIVEVISGTNWTISGTVVMITPETEIEGAISVGDMVKVEAMVAADGSLVAREIELLGDDSGGEASGHGHDATTGDDNGQGHEEGKNDGAPSGNGGGSDHGNGGGNGGGNGNGNGGGNGNGNGGGNGNGNGGGNGNGNGSGHGNGHGGGNGSHGSAGGND